MPLHFDSAVQKKTVVQCEVKVNTADFNLEHETFQ